MKMKLEHWLVKEFEVLFLEPKQSSIAAELLFTYSLQRHLEEWSPVAGDVRRADKHRHSIITQIAPVDQWYTPGGICRCRYG